MIVDKIVILLSAIANLLYILALGFWFFFFKDKFEGKDDEVINEDFRIAFNVSACSIVLMCISQFMR